ncbi:MAG: hypothetical protein Alpg2KO_12320 [Alphaproteobacteria bacterium]
MTYHDTHHHLGVYAIILSADRSEILLIEKARGPYTGLQDLPGGSLEPLETLEETLVREVREETGTTVTHRRQLQAVSTLFPYMQDGKPCCLRHVGVLYLAEIEGQINFAGDEEDAGRVVWQAISTLQADRVTPFVNTAISLI